MNEVFRLEGKVAIVTGGNGGIGKGISRGFASVGGDIVIVGRNQAKTDKAVSEIKEEYGVRVLGVKPDLRHEDNIQAMIAKALDEFGRKDAHRTVIGRKGLVKLGHLSTNGWSPLYQEYPESKVCQIQSCLYAGDPSPHNHHGANRILGGGDCSGFFPVIFHNELSSLRLQLALSQFELRTV